MMNHENRRITHRVISIRVFACIAMAVMALGMLPARAASQDAAVHQTRSGVVASSIDEALETADTVRVMILFGVPAAVEITERPVRGRRR